MVSKLDNQYPLRTVVVAGNFNPILRGHVEHIKKAKDLGDWLVVITHSDEINKKKCGYSIPLQDRVAVLESLKWVNKVVVSIDTDGTVAKTLEMLQPNIFAKGGDRLPETMPQNELDICEKYGIMIWYHVGELLTSSRKTMDECLRDRERYLHILEEENYGRKMGID